MPGMRTFGGDEPERDRRTVGVGEHVIADSGETLVAYGLGACVAVVIHDDRTGVGALAHTVLPRRGDSAAARGKFADSAVRAMLEDMIEAGATYTTARAWVVGGADIFELEDLEQDVGTRTVATARAALEGAGVPVADEAVGDDHGRTVEFDVGAGDVFVHTAESEMPTRLGDDAEDGP